MKKVFCFAVSHYLSTLSTSCAALVCVDMLAMYRRAAGQSENPLRPKTYNYFAGELMEQGLCLCVRPWPLLGVRGEIENEVAGTQVSYVPT
jgi:hypothetical protein